MYKGYSILKCMGSVRMSLKSNGEEEGFFLYNSIYETREGGVSKKVYMGN